MPKSVDWYYIRPKGCTACSKVSGYLESHGIPVAEELPASRKLQASDAKEILGRVKKLVAMKGKKVERFDVGASPTEEEIEAMLGPTGNLRAPTLLIGTTCLVGFNEEVFDEVF